PNRADRSGRGRPQRGGAFPRLSTLQVGPAGDRSHWPAPRDRPRGRAPARATRSALSIVRAAARPPGRGGAANDLAPGDGPASLERGPPRPGPSRGGVSGSGGSGGPHDPERARRGASADTTGRDTLAGMPTGQSADRGGAANGSGTGGERG